MGVINANGVVGIIKRTYKNGTFMLSESKNFRVTTDFVMKVLNRALRALIMT